MSRKAIVALVGAATLVSGGLLLYTVGHVRLANRASAAAPAAQAVWTCPMHPDVREPGPGQCPTCGMELVKEEPNEPPADAIEPTAGVPRAGVQLDTRRRQLLGVRTARAERTDLSREVRAVGLVRYDETRQSDVNLKVDGWVQKLYVASTGAPIRRGQPLLELYSPDLLATQNEYVLALHSRDAMQQSRIADARDQAEQLVQSARARMALWDLSSAQLDALERTRKATATITFRSPVSGFVIEKPAVEGMRVAPGQTLFRVVDLSAVWVEADVFESDAPFVKVGAPATVTVDAAPGLMLRGRAVYVYPFVEEKTRTLKVRFAFPNPQHQLKPGMYADVQLTSSLGSGLTIPADALLDAGQRQLVFVAEGDGYFRPRDVKAGQRVGDRVQILEGLEEGDEVGAGAAFFLDSESQLRAATGSWDHQGERTQAEAAGSGATIVLRTEPNPPRTGENTFEVEVNGADGQPLVDARVKLTLFMPAMPSMNMPAMSSEATLAPAGLGVYRGSALISMAGRWDVTITATRGGQRVVARHTTLVAR
jgi:RND family efflux transporter MFP subunit